MFVYLLNNKLSSLFISNQFSIFPAFWLYNKKPISHFGHLINNHAPYATIKDLRSQINTKFRITSDLYWLSCGGKPLFHFLLLGEIRGTVCMHGRLMGGVQCCLKGCENEAGSRKFDSMHGWAV